MDSINFDVPLSNLKEVLQSDSLSKMDRLKLMTVKIALEAAIKSQIEN